jgi:hypothetical protein
MTYNETMVETYVPNAAEVGMTFSDALALAKERDAEAAENLTLSYQDAIDDEDISIL